MTYREIVDRLGLPGVCFGGCGIPAWKHRQGRLFLGVIHWNDRQVKRRGLRRFLLLAARRQRETDPGTDDSAPTRGYLGQPRKFGWLYLYLDETQANAWAAMLGYRFPAAYSRVERARAMALLRGRSRSHPAVYAWARRGAD